jgi:Uma2 family endonuclease
MMLILDKTRAKLVRDSNGVAAPKQFMTEEEFVEWTNSTENIRAEWVDGEVLVLSPNSVEHDVLLIWLFNLLVPFVERHNAGTILGPNVTARLGAQKRRRIPDLLFVARTRQSLIKQNHVEGAPDLIIEIVSPESQSRDRRSKYSEYEKAGVREYWILDPLSRQMEAHVLKRGKYKEIEPEQDILRSVLLPGFFLNSSWLWRKPLPKVLTIQKELGLFD